MHSVETHARHKSWGLETWFLGLVGIAMIWQREMSHHMNVVQETIVLVVFLGG